MPHFHKIEKPEVAPPGNSETSTLPGSSESEKTLPATPLSVNLEAADIPKWDEYAAKAMAALIIDGEHHLNDENIVAQLAYDQADAMMVERAKRLKSFAAKAEAMKPPAFRYFQHKGDIYKVQTANPKSSEGNLRLMGDEWRSTNFRLIDMLSDIWAGNNPVEYFPTSDEEAAL